jgi:nucleotide-binding universal stress UspA family protein
VPLTPENPNASKRLTLGGAGGLELQFGRHHSLVEGTDMYKAIVVGTDGSERAGRAVAQAMALAKMFDATLHVVHAMRLVSLGAATYADAGAVAMANESARGDGEKICSHVLAEAERQGVRAEAHNVEGDPADMLIQMAEDVRADLVVIGNRGMTGVKRFVLGSVPNKVSHHCPCSLLIVDTDAT